MPPGRDEAIVAWGGCGVCACGVGNDGWLVWDRAGRIGTFACGRHVLVLKARFPGGTVEGLD